ncbi:MAG: adenylate/guanylate cyclase domain-containing protein [Pseudomonas marincola]|jgi:class 3 adenylate cyclase|nr:MULTISPECIES: adenylate/guanylate cyclase domain-containing protein [Pseudomonas]MAB98009.1 adenylate cyclase [Pseudomonadaceae bacterium]
MNATPPSRNNAASDATMREYYSRVIAYLIIAASVAVGTYCQHLAFENVWIVPYALLYPHLAQHLSKRLKQNKPHTSNAIMLGIDGLHCGIAIAFMGFSPVPSLMALLAVTFGALVSDGLRTGAVAVLSTIIGTVLTSAAISPQINLDTPPLLALASIGTTIVFICITGYFMHQQSLRLDAVRCEIKREQEKAARLARNLAKYLSPQVWESIFSGKKTVRLETQRKKLTVFFSDIKGFTELSEELEAEALTDLLNNYLNEMSKICLKYGGTIDKFIGDSVMVFFGDPASQGAKKDAVAAVSMAIAMRKVMKVLRQQWRSQGITKPLEIRMGLNTGYCTVGNFGADTRMDYTIIGRDVNLASRLESAAESGEILISHETYSLVKDVIMCCDKGQISVKGFTRPVQIYQVVDFRRDLGATSSYVEHEIPGFSMYLDTNGIQNFDKERVIYALQQAAEKLRDKVIM